MYSLCRRSAAKCVLHLSVVTCTSAIIHCCKAQYTVIYIDIHRPIVICAFRTDKHIRYTLCTDL